MVTVTVTVTATVIVMMMVMIMMGRVCARPNLMRKTLNFHTFNLSYSVKLVVNLTPFGLRIKDGAVFNDTYDRLLLSMILISQASV